MINQNYEVYEDVVSRDNQDGTVIVMKMDEGNMFFKLTNISAEIWRELTQKKGLNQIFSDVMENYDVSEEVLRQDVTHLMKGLVEKRLIKEI